MPDSLRIASGELKRLKPTPPLEAEVNLPRERLSDKDDVVADLRARLDVEGEERRKLTSILTAQRRNQELKPKRSLWARITG